MKIIENGSTPSVKGPQEWFTGQVRIDFIFQKQENTRASGAMVTFEPGARTAWHTHPAGQTLIIESGLAWVQVEGEPIIEVFPGDVIYFEPNEKHWHGATDKKAMSHLAIQEEIEGTNVVWLEHVTDKEYAANE